MKLNWGTGIALVYGTFVLVMVGAVIASRQHDPGLVEKNYYDLDLNYQEHMEKKQNAANLNTAPFARFDADQHRVVVQFPDGMSVSGGSIKFFRSATVQDDFRVRLEPGTQGAIEVPADKLPNGRWHLELDWEAGGKKFFYATTVTISNA